MNIRDFSVDELGCIRCYATTYAEYRVGNVYRGRHGGDGYGVLDDAATAMVTRLGGHD